MKEKNSLLFCAILFANVLMAQNKSANVPPPPAPIDAQQVAPPPPPKKYEDLLSNHPDIRSIHWSDSGRKLHIDYKNGTKEVYTLDVQTKESKAEKKSGELPPPPPPPPMPSSI